MRAEWRASEVCEARTTKMLMLMKMNQERARLAVPMSSLTAIAIAIAIALANVRAGWKAWRKDSFCAPSALRALFKRVCKATMHQFK